MSGWRVRVDPEGKLILQVLEMPEYDPGIYRSEQRKAGWRDASVSDIPLGTVFPEERTQVPVLSGQSAVNWLSGR